MLTCRPRTHCKITVHLPAATARTTKDTDSTFWSAACTTRAFQCRRYHTAPPSVGRSGARRTCRTHPFRCGKSYIGSCRRLRWCSAELCSARDRSWPCMTHRSRRCLCTDRELFAEMSAWSVAAARRVATGSPWSRDELRRFAQAQPGLGSVWLQRAWGPCSSCWTSPKVRCLFLWALGASAGVWVGGSTRGVARGGPRAARSCTRLMSPWGLRSGREGETIESTASPSLLPPLFNQSINQSLLWTF